MRKLTLIALTVLANLSMPSPASADSLDGAAEATLTWRLGFGGGQPGAPGLGLALGYRSQDADGLAGRLLDLDLSGSGAQARLAGLPLFGSSYTAAQNEGAPPAESAQKPWYTQSWALWTAGGLAAALALSQAAGNIDQCTGICGQDGNEGGSNVASVNNGEVCGTQGVDGAPDTCAAPPGGCTPGGDACVNCDDSVVTSGCEGSGWTARPVRVAVTEVRDTEPAWLSAGTGYMGDLLAR